MDFGLPFLPKRRYSPTRLHGVIQDFAAIETSIEIVLLEVLRATG